MTTKKEFIEWLNRFPDETIIEVGIQGTSGNYESYGWLNFVSPILTDSDVGDGWEFSDFKNNKFVKETDEYYNKSFLRLGERS
jgi:hypothetical protein